MENKQDNQKADHNLSKAPTGSASNPSPDANEMEPANHNQWIDEKGEKYLRESGNIEDEPDARDQQEADDILRKQKRS